MDQYKELTNDEISITEFISRLKSKDPVASKIYHDFICNLSITINNISQSFNPHIIVIKSKIVENIPESISEIKNRLRSQVMLLDILTTSEFKSKTNVLGLTYVLIQEFLKVEN